MPSPALLRLERVSRRFGGIRAVAALDLSVQRGERVGLVGPNGSGKTTVLNLISGIYPPDEGRIWLGDEPMNGKAAHAFARRGIARTFQNLRVPGRLSVFENVWIAQPSAAGAGPPRRGVAEERRRRREIVELLAALGLDAVRDEPAASLPLPELRKLELARALTRAPRLLLLDEPTGGMTPAETADTIALIARLVPQETALVVVEHKLDVVTSLCGRIAVLDAGCKIAEGPPAQVLRDERVIRIYLDQPPPGDARG